MRRTTLMALLIAGMGMGATAQGATKLMFRVFEPFTPTYYSRVLVTPRYLRMDEGPASRRYALLDRDNQVLYNVDHEARTVTVIEKRPVADSPPMELKVEERGYRGRYYRVAGRKAKLKRYTVEGETCLQVSAAPELLPEATAALAEFRALLAGEHHRLLAGTPADQRDRCDMAINIFYPTRYLEDGFPLEESDGRGYRRFLVDYQESSTLGEGWARVPTDYTRHHPDTAAH